MASVALALASLKAAAADCVAAKAGFGPDEAAAGLFAAEELRALFLPLARGRGTATSAGVLAPAVKPLGRQAARPAVAAEPALLLLPPEIFVMVLFRLDVSSLARVAATCSELYRDKPRPMTLVEEALRQRAAARGHVCPERLTDDFSSWAGQLIWLEHRRDQAWAPVAASLFGSFFVAEGGRLMSCGTEARNGPNGEIRMPGLLGFGELDNGHRVVSTPTLLPSMVDVRIRCVAGGCGFRAAVSAEGKVYTWGEGDGRGLLGHGDAKDCLIPKPVQALAGCRVIALTAGWGHCLAVTERGELFSWGDNREGPCGHESDAATALADFHLLPRRVKALAGVRVRSASAGSGHSLVVTEEGALYSFGGGREGRLGHGDHENLRSPKRVDALRHVRIAAAAAGDAHSLAVAKDGTVFSWGSDDYGQLGTGHTDESGEQLLPQTVDSFSGLQVCALAAGGRSSCAVTAIGELFTWGQGGSGQLGHGNADHQAVPRRVEALQDVRVVAVSLAIFNIGHVLAVTHDGSVFGWGRAEWLGLSETAITTVLHPDDQALRCIVSPCRYPQLSCMRS